MARITQLDGVRGLAVLLVLLHNSDTYPSLHLGFVSANGWMGVELFFVLSGFLITGLLLDHRGAATYFSTFYLRRCFRIWPLYYSALLLMFLVVPLLQPSEQHTIFGARSSPWWSYLIFMQNFFVPVPTMAAGLLGVTWSLAVEAQFYLVWPLVVWLLTENQLRRIALAVIVFSPVLRYYLSLHHVIIYSNTFCRADGLMAGTFLALMVRSRHFDASKFLGAAWVSLFSFAGLALMMERLDARWLGFSFVVLASLSFVYLALFSQQGWLQALLRSRFLIYTGVISYGLYLLAKIPCGVVHTLHIEEHPLIALFTIVATTYVLAGLSWRYLEKPMLDLGARLSCTGGRLKTSVAKVA